MSGVPAVLVPTRTATSDSQQSYVSYDTFGDDDDDYHCAFDSTDVVGVPSEPEAQVLSGLDVASEQEQQIESIAALFEVTRLDASIMLRKFAWHTERLIESFFNDPAAVREKAGLSSTAKRHRSTAESSTSCAGAAGDEDVMCGVCFCAVTVAAASSLTCGHLFCNECWEGHLRVQISDGNADKVACMAEGCSVLVEPPLAQALLDAPTYAKFARFAQKQFVDDNPYMKWCPAVGCENVIKVADIGVATETACTCGMLFCFACSREAHFPLSCATLTRWEDKNASDSSTGQWFQAHARRCRKCHSFIEKNGGCNWIRCRCGHEVRCGLLRAPARSRSCALAHSSARSDAPSPLCAYCLPGTHARAAEYGRLATQFCYFCFSTDHAHHNQPCNAPPPREADDAKTDLEYYMVRTPSAQGLFVRCSAACGSAALFACVRALGCARRPPVCLAARAACAPRSPLSSPVRRLTLGRWGSGRPLAALLRPLPGPPQVAGV